MTKYRYTYKGKEEVHLPLHGILAKGGDEKTVYETDVPIKHEDFDRVEDKKERKEEKDQSKS